MYKYFLINKVYNKVGVLFYFFLFDVSMEVLVFSNIFVYNIINDWFVFINWVLFLVKFCFERIEVIFRIESD